MIRYKSKFFKLYCYYKARWMMNEKRDEDNVVVNTLDGAKKLIIEHSIHRLRITRYLNIQASNNKCCDIDLYDFREGVPSYCSGSTFVTEISLSPLRVFKKRLLVSREEVFMYGNVSDPTYLITDKKIFDFLFLAIDHALFNSKYVSGVRGVYMDKRLLPFGCDCQVDIGSWAEFKKCLSEEDKILVFRQR